jgi:hypothetical protein
MVYPANKSLVLGDDAWPTDVRWVRAAFLATDEGKSRPDATPRFILAQDNKVILAAAGNAGWKDQMWPKIAEVTGTKA